MVIRSLYGINKLSDRFFNRKHPLRVSYFLLYTLASVSLVYVLRTKCKNIYQNDFLFINTCTRGRDECVYVWVRVCMID